MMVLILLAYGAIAFFQTKALIKKKHWRDLVFGSILLALALTLTLLYDMGVKIPSPMHAAAQLFDAMNLKFDIP